MLIYTILPTTHEYIYVKILHFLVILLCLLSTMTKVRVDAKANPDCQLLRFASGELRNMYIPELSTQGLTLIWFMNTKGDRESKRDRQRDREMDGWLDG